jgi:carboxylesterase
VAKIPNPEPLELPGGSIGVLLLPGFGRSSAPLTALARSLNQVKLTVLLSEVWANSTGWDGLNRANWQAGNVTAETEFRKLQRLCSTIFVMGHGVGGATALHLAQSFGGEIAGVILLEPSLPIHRRQYSQIWRKIEEDLAQVDQPALLIYSLQDHLLNSNSSMTVGNEISSRLIREVILEDSFHGTSLDHDGPLLVEETLAFINEIASGIWLSDIDMDDETDLIDAEFQSIVSGLSLDESAPSTYLDELDGDLSDEHFDIPNPKLLPISDPTRRNAILAMFLGPLWAIIAAITNFNPLGVEPWPGVLAFFGGLALFLYRLRDDYQDDDGAIL